MEVIITNSKQVLDLAMNQTGKTFNDLAEVIGWNGPRLCGRVNRASLTSDDFLTLLESMGIEVKFINTATGKELRQTVKGHGRALKGMSNGVIYDTAQSDALSNNFYEDGVNEYDKNGSAVELYLDREGRYFLAEYSNNGETGKINAIPPAVAVSFLEKYGTEIEKKTD